MPCRQYHRIYRRLNTWLQYIAQKQLQAEARNIEVWEFILTYIRDLTVDITTNPYLNHGAYFANLCKYLTQCHMCKCVMKIRITSRADSRFAYSQWEKALLCNDISHWLGASLESTLTMYITELSGTSSSFVLLQTHCYALQHQT